MPITRLSLTDFRSYADALIAPGPGFVVLTGDNGAGKTNVLEAISLLTPGRGLRGTALSEMARHGGAGGFGVSARLGSGDSSVELGTGTLAAQPERRVVRINGATASAAALGEWLSLVWLTPAQDRLFAESAGSRRRFLDRLVLALDPGHAHDSSRYEAAMRQRNRLLAGERPDAEWLAALEAAMVEHGQAIAARRAALIDSLGQRLADTPTGPFARAGLALDGFDAGADFVRALAGGRSRDAAANRTLTGPHRQDLIVTHLDKGVAAASSSTGEQKALLIGIILAHAELVAEAHGRRPLLLLDEVAAHLDPVRRTALFDRLATGGGQVWLTGTEREPFEAIGTNASWLAVENGAIRPD
ncbi:DNA replication/repair protein RecF [Sphingomonas sp. SUN039]|uniref:DNA replication/repair protein RecF n=1 Tax=Sphingomonas sp. SUN039 TaxID=2937787 RepID=UPI002164C6A5|nr:DNA replication/repair protein RecF [Sphingomonas sp. SUN039]UVO54960.1 DNA replication/repair protein RecF [Sphingomonas sp. SUN039]